MLPVTHHPAVALVELDHPIISACVAAGSAGRAAHGAGDADEVQCSSRPLPPFPLSSPPKYRSLAAVLESDAQFADWSARRRQEVELTRLLRKHLPRPIADRVRVADARDGVLELAASAIRKSGARDGLDFTEIRVRVQVAALAAARVATTQRPWDSRDAAPLFELAERLDDGPLKAVLSRWSRRARGR